MHPSILPRLLLFLTLACAAQAATIQPKDNGAALVNPGMGWAMHFYSNFAEDFPGQYFPVEPIEAHHQVPHDKPDA